MNARIEHNMDNEPASASDPYSIPCVCSTNLITKTKHSLLVRIDRRFLPCIWIRSDPFHRSPYRGRKLVGNSLHVLFVKILLRVGKIFF